jgi:hypothetical protein
LEYHILYNIYIYLIRGDLNARTAFLKDYISKTTDIPQFNEYDDLLNDLLNDINVPDRANVDTHRSRFEKLLVDFCIINSFLIVNGRLVTDKGKGDCTYVSNG